MIPQLQTAFDTMYAKAEMFLPANIAKQCLIHIRKGDYGIPTGEVAAALAEYLPIPATAAQYRKAVSAFGDFWAVFSERVDPQITQMTQISAQAPEQGKPVLESAQSAQSAGQNSTLN